MLAIAPVCQDRTATGLTFRSGSSGHSSLVGRLSIESHGVVRCPLINQSPCLAGADGVAGHPSRLHPGNGCPGRKFRESNQGAHPGRSAHGGHPGEVAPVEPAGGTRGRSTDALRSMTTVEPPALPIRRPAGGSGRMPAGRGCQQLTRVLPSRRNAGGERPPLHGWQIPSQVSAWASAFGGLR